MTIHGVEDLADFSRVKLSGLLGGEGLVIQGCQAYGGSCGLFVVLQGLRLWCALQPLTGYHMVLSQNMGHQYRPPNTAVLLVAQKGTRNFGKPPYLKPNLWKPAYGDAGS